jgi:hypothetical protein
MVNHHGSEPQLAAKIVSVEPVDHPADGRIAALVRRSFGDAGAHGNV